MNFFTWGASRSFDSHLVSREKERPAKHERAKNRKSSLQFTRTLSNFKLQKGDRISIKYFYFSKSYQLVILTLTKGKGFNVMVFLV